MAAAWIMKQNDTWPPMPAQLKDAAGPIDLTTANAVALHLKAQGSGGATGGGACVVVDAAAGRVTYTFTTADTDTVTLFDGEFEIDWGSGQTTTVPNDGYFQVQITQELDVP